ncbi:hypothetical protein ES703_110603 [subsurface metagenome]
MKKSLIHFIVSVPPNNQASVIAEPRYSTLNLPATPVSPQCSPILKLGFSSILTMRGHKFNALLPKPSSKFIRIITLVANQLFRLFANLLQSFIRQFHLMWAGSVNGHSQRNTLAVCHHHKLRALATLGLANFGAPFLAGTKLPSIKHSAHWIRPFLSSCPMNARQILSHTPCSSQSLSLRQQVEALGYCFGKSAQGAPVRSTHKMPSKTLRLSAQGLPPRLDFLGFGSNGSIFSIVHPLISIFPWP